jgi:hypothetical protein
MPARLTKPVQLPTGGLVMVGLLALLLAAGTTASAAATHRLERPIIVRSSANEATTTNGLYCANRSCPGSRARPHLRPRLRVHSRHKFSILVPVRAGAVYVEFYRPGRRNPLSIVVLADRNAHPFGPRRRHWRLKLPHKVNRATAMGIGVSYRHGASFYQAGIRILH